MFSFDDDEEAAPGPDSGPPGDAASGGDGAEEEDGLDEGDDQVIMVDAWRVPRGRCTNANCKCRLWTKASGPFSHLHCGGCKCKTTEHQDLSAWLRQVLEHSTPSVESRLVSKGIPVKAYTRWSPLDTLFHLETEGAFLPERDGRTEAVPSSASSQPLCTVICPTTSDRHAFHPLLYHCFCLQSYQPKELVVIDTGHKPSAFLAEKAKRDPSLVYRWFKSGTGRWTIGTKRNLACFLSRGELVAHFDDDDLYAADYLQRMNGAIIGAADGQEATIGAARVAATLTSWHVFDTSERTFRFLHAVSDKWVYGWGFSFAYTRGAWSGNFFPCRDIGEDFDFMMALRKLPGGRVLKVEEEGAICSHTYHPKLSISGGEKRRDGTQAPIGKEASPPDALVPLLPLLFEAERRSLKDMGRRQPSEDDYTYSILGSWDGWSNFYELKRAGRLLSATIAVPPSGAAAPTVLEFQVYANNDFALAYYPAATGGILGPWRCPGQNWKVQLPKGRDGLAVTWDPSPEKRITIQTVSSGNSPKSAASRPAAAPKPAPQPPRPSAPSKPVAAGPAARKGQLGLREAIELQEALIFAYKREDFQQKLREIWMKTQDPVQRTKLRQDLCLPIQGPLIARYGFEPNRLGVAQCVNIFHTADWRGDPTVSKNNDVMSWLCDIDSQLKWSAG